MPKHVLVLDLVCLTLDHLQDRAATPNLNALADRGYAVSLRPPFPTPAGSGIRRPAAPGP